MIKQQVTKTRISLLLLVFILIRSTILGQSSEDLRNIFTQAESYYIYEEYELANQLYLLIESPDNMNLKHKIGTCYLNIPGEKEKSVLYLEDAIKSANYDSKTESFKETRAPIDVYFSLAKAYMINNEFEKALSILQDFKRLANENAAKGGMENLEFIDQQINACKNAIQFRQVPMLFGKQGLGQDFSMGSINENSVVSYDGKTIVYTERRGIENAIFFSRKEADKWNTPVEITLQLKAGVDCSSTSLNNDGTKLFLYKTDNYDGAIYSSDYVNGVWTPIKKLNKSINTKYYESHASISSDGKKLFFSSNREGGMGNLDIYVSELDENGNWGSAANLGPEINTPFNEDTPFVSMNDSLLFFCSEGHNTMGGYDIFKSQKTGSVWKTPSNLGYPVNSADDDKFFQPYNNGNNAYYSITTGYKKKEIFYLDMKNPDLERQYRIEGKLLTGDDKRDSSLVSSVKVINKISGDTLYTVYPDNIGSYKISTSPGFFRILYSCGGYYSQKIDTIIVPGSEIMLVNIDVTLQKDTTSGVVTIPTKYEKIDLGKIPEVNGIDTSILIKNMNVNDETDKSVKDEDILYFTVQVIALHKPVDVSYFKYIRDLKVMYNENDRFYRYTTGNFQSKEEAYRHRLNLISKGYPKQIFIKKISK